jgi:eukaryotic-like serine/threonine-protein kinase
MADRAERPMDEEALDQAFARYLTAMEEGGCAADEWKSAAPELARVLADHRQFFRWTDQLRELVSSSTHGGPRQAALAAPLPAGVQIGDYELVEVLGRGGMGIVYGARHVTIPLTVALKMLGAPRRAAPDRQARFLAEVESQARLHHPRIVPVLGGGEHDGWLYFTMKWMEGGDLASAARVQSFASRRIAEMMAELARAVHHAHQRGLLHRDLKPSNILLDAEGNPYVADFGLAWNVSDESEGVSDVAGTPGYIAPEALTGRHTVLSDIYGLGKILEGLLAARADHDWEYDDKYLSLICEKCLATEPEERYASADALAVDLERYLARRHPLGVPVRRRDRWRWWCSRNPWSAAAAGAFLLSVLLVVVAVLSIIDTQRRSLRAALALVELQRESYRETPEMAGLKEHLLKTNRHPELARMFQQRDLRGIQQFCHEARDRFAAQDPRSSRMVASWFAVGLDRTVWADSSRPGLRTPVDDRDYTAWAFAELASGEDGGGEVFESSLYKSRSDGLYKYAVVARVPSREDPPVILGALAVSIAPESSRAMDSYESLLERAYLWLILASTPWIGLGMALAVWRLRRSGRLLFLGGR